MQDSLCSLKANRLQSPRRVSIGSLPVTSRRLRKDTPISPRSTLAPIPVQKKRTNCNDWLLSLNDQQETTQLAQRLKKAKAKKMKDNMTASYLERDRREGRLGHLPTLGLPKCTPASGPKSPNWYPSCRTAPILATSPSHYRTTLSPIEE